MATASVRLHVIDDTGQCSCRACRSSRPQEMTPTAAKRIAGSLGRPSKMPGFSYGIDAWECQVGAALVDVPGTTCHGCYARKNFYATWIPAIVAREKRQASLDHPLWVDAMVALIRHHCVDGGELWFRWHDSGDLQSSEHLARICRVAELTPTVRHWLPTREYAHVRAFLRRRGVIPDNLTVRLSAHVVDDIPRVSKTLRALPTSTVHEVRGKPVAVSERRRDTVECRAALRDNHCGACRACWTPEVRNVSYPRH